MIKKSWEDYLRVLYELWESQADKQAGIKKSVVANTLIPFCSQTEQK
jgi:hypothetical protein